MLHEALFSSVHYLGVMVLFAALAAQHGLFTPRVSPAQLRLLGLLDAIYAVALLLVLVTGLLKTFYWGAGADYYLRNGLFHSKMALFVLMVLLSLWPTFCLLRARRHAGGLTEGQTLALPASIGAVQRIALLCVLLMPLLAAFMARGFGI